MKVFRVFSQFIVCVALLNLFAITNAQEIVIVDDFENGLSATWSAKSFKDETKYEVVTNEGRHVLQATSLGSASGLMFEREFDVYENSVLAWSWKIESTVEGGDYRQKTKDDFAARVYVTFPHWFFPKTTSLNYVWANQMVKEEIQPNAYTSNAMMIAVETGNQKAGRWLDVKRDIIADYRRAFGKEPPRKAVIAIMTDTDNTGETARAWYDNIYWIK